MATYTAVTFVDGDPLPAQPLTDMSAAIAALSTRHREVQTFASATASITFSGIPTTLTALTLQITGRGDTASTFAEIRVQFGGDTGSNYKSAISFWQAAAAGTNNTATTAVSGLLGYVPAASTTAGIYGGTTVNIIGWNSPHSGCLTWNGHGGYHDITSNSLHAVSSGCYIGGSAYTSLRLFPSAGNFASGTQVTLIGE